MTAARDLLQIDLSGLQFSFSVDDPRVLPILERLWQPFLVPPEAQEAATPVRVCIHEEPMPFFQIGEDEPGLGPDLWVVLYGARLHVVQRALEKARERFVYLHAAVLEAGGRAIVLAGPYDSGKTTFSMELLRRGWSLLSDDVALIDPDNLAIEWFPKPLGIKRGEWDDYKDLWDPQPGWLPRPTGAFLVPATAFSLCRKVEKIETLVFLRFDEASPTTVEEVSPGRAVTLAMECSASSSQRSLRAFSALTERARSILKVTHGGQTETVKSVVQLLNREISEALVESRLNHQ